MTPSNSFSLPNLAPMLSTFVAHLCIFSCLNSSGSTVFAPFRGRGILRLCLLPSLRSRTRTLTPICSKRFCQIRGNELDDAGTHELVHHIRGKATPEEEALGSFARRKLKPLPIWDVWLVSEWLQLDSHQKQKVFGAPSPAPPGATLLRSHWNYIIKPCGTRKARMCCDGSKRAAPEFRFAQMYASCIDQPCMRLFFALSAAMGFVVKGADCTNTNAYANSPSPTQPTFVWIDDAYADWYRARHGKDVDRSLVLPVLKALQGHPEAGALWEKHINKILDDLDIVYTIHERSIYQGKIDGKVVLLGRQVDDLAVACSDPTVAQGLIDSIGNEADLKSQDTLESYNGIDVDQRREYVKISCQSYLTRMLKTNGWDKPSPTEKSDSKPIEALAASTAEELSTLIGPTEGTTENRTLEKEIGLSYRQVRPCTVRPGRGAGQISLVRLLFGSHSAVV
jgi:hypothetical protein